MKLDYLKKLMLIIFSSTLMNTAYADNLGTIFTSYKDRQKLEKIRNKKEPKKIEIVKLEVEASEEEPLIKKEMVIRDPISLTGIVHRSSGKSTAWVNGGNTFEGNLDSEFIQVPANEIKSDQVTVIMSEDNSEFKLKVGDVYTPDPIEREVVDTVDTEID